MWGFGQSKKLQGEKLLEVETAISVTFSEHIPVTNNIALLEHSLGTLTKFAKALDNIPEGDSVEVETLKHKRVKISRKGGKLEVKNTSFE